MLIEAVLDIVVYVFAIVLTPVNIPQMPFEMQEVFMQGLGYLSMGLSFLGNFVDLDYLLVLIGIIVSVDVGLMFYRFFVWIIKKIPFLGVK